MEYYNELYHYGVRGQKWGVRRYQNPDGSLTEAGRKRQTTLVKKIDKLDSKYSKLEKVRTKQIKKADVKVAELESKAAKNTKKAKNGFFRSDEKREYLESKADEYQNKADRLKAKSDITKAEMAKNRAMRDALSKKLSDLNNAEVEAGKKKLASLVEANNKAMANNKFAIKDDNGNTVPIFRASEEQREALHVKYENDRKRVLEKYKNAKSESEKERYGNQLDRMETDYMDVVEQDFWFK